MTNKVYDTLKIVALIIAPLGAFIVSMLSIWTNVDTASIVATVTAIETFLGSLLALASNKYAKEH